MALFPNGFMPAIQNNSNTLLMTGLGLLSGPTAQQQAALGAQGFMQGRQASMDAKKLNQTVQWLKTVNPQLAQAVEMGALSPADAYKTHLQAQMPKQTDTMQNLTWRAQQAGLRPGTKEYADFMRTGGSGPGTQITIGDQYGKAPAGFSFAYNPDGSPVMDERGVPKLFPMQGGPEDTARTDLEKSNQAAIATQTITNAADRARQAAADRNFGPYGQGLAEKMSWTDSAEVRRQVNVLKSQATIQNLNAMRAASPTGGALGNVTEKEGAMLADKSGALDPTSPTFERDLNDYELTLLQVVHGPKEGLRIFQESMMKQPQQQGARALGGASQAGSINIDGYTIEPQ